MRVKCDAQDHSAIYPAGTLQGSYPDSSGAPETSTLTIRPTRLTLAIRLLSGKCFLKIVAQGRLVRKVDNAIHLINYYPADSVVCFGNTYLLDNDLSGG